MTLFGNSSIARVLLAGMLVTGILVAGISVSQAQSPTHLDKHARKIHHKLAKYPAGRYLHLVLRDSSDSYGALGKLSADSFTFTSADNNTTASYQYSEIDKIKTDKQPIGERSEPRFHHMRHMVPIVVSVAALGTAGAVYAATQ